MIRIRRHTDRGLVDHGWLKAAHSFSFGAYHDPDWTGFRALRVINEDRIAPRRGFAEHPHRDMEIITYPIAGAVRHTDSLGHREDITPGMVQAMTAGSGIRHAEHNPCDAQTHLLQIWIEPRGPGLAPSHTSSRTRVHDEPGRFHTIASPDGRDGSPTINQDASVLAGVFGKNRTERVELAPGRHAWIQIVSGAARVLGETLAAGDGAAISGESRFDIGFDTGFDGETELLLFDLA